MKYYIIIIAYWHDPRFKRKVDGLIRMFELADNLKQMGHSITPILPKIGYPKKQTVADVIEIPFIDLPIVHLLSFHILSIRVFAEDAQQQRKFYICPSAEPVCLVHNFANAARLGRLPISMIKGDILDLELLEKAMAGCQIVFNCVFGKTGNEQLDNK